MIKFILFIWLLTTPLFCEQILNYREAFNLSQYHQSKSHYKKLKTIKTYFLKFNTPEEIKENLETLFPSALITVNKYTKSITVRDTKNTLKKISSLITKLEKPSDRIRIDIQIIEIFDIHTEKTPAFFSSNENNFNINLNFQKNKIQTIEEIKGTLAGMIQKGKAKTIANPSIATLDNHKVSISLGEKVPYTTTIINDKEIGRAHV